MNLNETVWCKLGASTIHGVGVFAIRDIPQGQRLYLKPQRHFGVYRGGLDELLPEIREIVLQRYPLAPEGGEYLSPNDDQRLIVFMNHASPANYDWETDTALVDIPKGTEITEDYGSYAPSGIDSQKMV